MMPTRVRANSWVLLVLLDCTVAWRQAEAFRRSVGTTWRSGRAHGTEGTEAAAVEEGKKGGIRPLKGWGEQEQSLDLQAANILAAMSPLSQQIFCYLKQELYPIYKLNKIPIDLEGNKTCAVVSNSGGQLLHEFGEEIDKHDVVFRFNLAPTRTRREGADHKNYKKNVGERTTFRLGWKYPHDEEDLALNYTLTAPWKTNPGYNKSIDVLGSMYPTQLGLETAATKNPTSGFYGLMVALSNCKSVDAYEMTPSIQALANGMPYQYFSDLEPHSSVNSNSWHGYIRAEHDIWKRLSRSGWETGRTTYPGFMVANCPEHVSSPGNLELFEANQTTTDAPQTTKTSEPGFFKMPGLP